MFRISRGFGLTIALLYLYWNSFFFIASARQSLGYRQPFAFRQDLKHLRIFVKPPMLINSNVTIHRIRR